MEKKHFNWKHKNLYNNLSQTGSNQKIKNGKPVGKGNK